MRGALTRSRRLHALVLLVGLVLVAAAVGGIAWAAIPQDGVYTGCYHKSNGNLRVIDASGTCKSNETRITWQPARRAPPCRARPLRHDDWCGGEGCPDALEFTNADIGVSRTLITIERPADGLWDNAVAIGDVNVVNGTPQPVTFACNGAIYTIPAARPGPPSGRAWLLHRHVRQPSHTRRRRCDPQLPDRAVGDGTEHPPVGRLGQRCRCSRPSSTDPASPTSPKLPAGGRWGSEGASHQGGENMVETIDVARAHRAEVPSTAPTTYTLAKARLGHGLLAANPLSREGTFTSTDPTDPGKREVDGGGHVHRAQDGGAYPRLLGLRTW